MNFIDKEIFMLKPLQLFHFDSFPDERGTLCVFESSADFQIRRVFWIRDVPSDASRGNHASVFDN